ncbi:PilZ domain-containing protein [Sphingomonas sp.]|uniref:PilZ domain-containing protein n=1 Tax=Sphingomonas sp. TaxID=28214 RepID=UPI0025E8CE27|nr:PilZ domain-containing protein [Sphingomonas sp.]MBV9528353.1 PilZ domain-containing protein [Sphingomonas sp.]
MDESSTPQNRRARRSPVFLTATIEVAGIPEPVKLRNLSEEGVLIEGDRLPPEGTRTCFQRKDLLVESRIIWVQGRYAGVAFDHPLKPEDVLRHVAKPRPTAKLDHRRPGLACRPLSTNERKMIEQWLSISQVPRPGE